MKMDSIPYKKIVVTSLIQACLFIGAFLFCIGSIVNLILMPSVINGFVFLIMAVFFTKVFFAWCAISPTRKTKIVCSDVVKDNQVEIGVCENSDSASNKT